ncbi:hypothetical protein [Companilactobacillus metriopterae]|uniref:hypothetical protein n=1 Tax=Companilactobacillus metriopterae TaxID=1909267 RepID=UPI00100A4D2B|nr:hypothetical protein [Companilactobacillus metriopterae]
MEKTITVDGREIILKSMGNTALIYGSQFNHDFFADLMKLANVMPTDKNGKVKDPEKWTDEDLDKLNFTPIYNFVWATAKTADSKIPEPMEWFGTFEEFPIMEIMPEIQELMMVSVQGKKGLKTSTKQTKR